MAHHASLQSMLVGSDEIIPTIAEVTEQSHDLRPSEVPRKIRGRQRLLQGLRRIASSTSLTRAAGPSSPRAGGGYRGGGVASMSCIAFASPTLASPMATSTVASGYGHSHHHHSHSSPESLNFSTAPTSLSNTPPPTFANSHTSGVGWLEKGRARTFGRSLSRSRPATPLTAPLPSDLRFRTPLWQNSSGSIQNVEEDYFSLPVASLRAFATKPARPEVDFWKEMPPEIRIRIMSHLEPKEIVRASAVSRAWHDMCFDGQLWKSLDCSEIYREIPADSLIKILTQAGPFVKDLNLRGCVQMRDRWQKDGQTISDLCRNMEYLSLKDCKIDKKTVNFFILRNPRLVHVDLSGVNTVNNTVMRILAQTCPQLQHLDVSWCPQIDTHGLEEVIRSCAQLRELRAGKTHGWSSENILLALFENNSLETLMLPHCTGLDDNAFLLLTQGRDPVFDCLTDRALVPARKFRHLDFTGCKRLTNKAIKSLQGSVPDLESLCLHGCISLTDDAIAPLLTTVPKLTHLDLEELGHISNASLFALAAAPCAPHLRHLSLSYCESIGDTGVLSVIKACHRLKNLEVDNTRVGDLTLHEAAAKVHARNLAATVGTQSGMPEFAMRLVAYDCANVTWTGVLAVLEKNAEFFHRHSPDHPVYPCEVINLKCFYGFQPTVDEHTKRVLKGELAKATILARKWHDWMQATEEAGVQGAGGWRRRRRAREAERQVEGEGANTDTMPGRRRARSGGCVVM